MSKEINMKELIQVFNGINIPVEVQDEKNIWFTVSAVSTKYNKKVSDWKNQKRVKQLLTMVGKATGIKENLIKSDSMGRTQIHKDMFISFARFVSVEFEYVSNKIITDILLGEKHLFDDKFNQLEIENRQKSEQLKESQQLLSEAKRKIHAYPRNNGFEPVTRIIKDNSVNITPYDLNQLLVKVGLLSVEVIEINHYKGLVMSGNIPLVHTDTVLKLLDEKGYKRGLGFLDTHPTFDYETSEEYFTH